MSDNTQAQSGGGNAASPNMGNQASSRGDRVEELLLIWQKSFDTPLVGVDGGEGYYLLCGAPYGDSVIMPEDVERTERIDTRPEAVTDDLLAQALALLIRYRNETPLGHQPHMIAHEADEAIAALSKVSPLMQGQK